jgi:hypothetical protein
VAVRPDPQHAEEEATTAAPQASEGTRGPTVDIAGRPANLLALQRQIGNASVARLIGEAERRRAPVGPLAPARPGQEPSRTSPDPGAAGFAALQRAVATRAGRTAESALPESAVQTPDLTPARQETVQRSFFGKVWGGIKHAASAVGSGVKTAATAVGGAVKTAATAVAGAVSAAADAVWDGAKAAGNWAVDWLRRAGSAVVDAIRWFGPKAWDVIKVIGTAAWEKLSLLGELAWDFVSLMPIRVWHAVISQWDALAAALSTLLAGVSGGITWAWAKQALISAGFWAFEVLVHVLEVVGIVDAFQFVWGLVFHVRELTEDEIKASQSVHGLDLIPYAKTRVDQHSFMVRLGKGINKLLGDPNASERAITTFHIIHAPEKLPIEVAVHELTHVAQYEHVGAAYMPQALHGQVSEMGYDYGNLTTARAEGKHYCDFNREQQAQMAEDYYLVRHKQAAEYKATEAELEPFMVEMRAGQF